MAYDTEQIRKLVLDQLAWDCRIDSKNITVEVTDHKVSLFGKVHSYRERQASQADVWAIPGIGSVENHLRVERPEGAKAMSDDKIAWDVKSALALNSTIDETAIQVSVKDSVIFLNGSVDEYWKKQRVEEIAYDVPGVYEIVDTISVVPTKAPFDQAIASDLMNALSRTGKINPESINVEVSGGRVILKGKVPNWETYSFAHNIAKYTRGVTDLVNELVIA
jgi:osmotically-inducible protein OsmY